jgi:hypothetical protein
MRETRTYGSARGAAGNSRPLYANLGQFPPPSFVAGVEELASIPDARRGQLPGLRQAAAVRRRPAALPWRQVLPQ